MYKNICVRCRICEKHCPVEAIKVDRYPIFDYDKCIRCFCCREGCKEGAIYVKAPILNYVINRVIDFMNS